MAKSGQNKSMKLSKNLAQMKFMQRRAKKDAEEEQESEKQQQIDDTHWVLDLPELISKGNHYEVVHSMADCEDLVFGRMSFKGMNPAIERVMKVMEEGEDEEEDEELAEGMSDQEMAERYSSLVDTMSKKLSKKRNHGGGGGGGGGERGEKGGAEPPAKRKHKKSFLKPPDE